MFGLRNVRLVVITTVLLCRWLGAQPAGPIAIEESDRETIARVEVGGCRVSLEWMRAELLLRYRNDCEQSLETKTRIFSALAEKLSSEYQVFETVRTLSIGRLSVTFPTLAREISLAGSTSPKWDAKRGRAAQAGQFQFGLDNSFFRDTANELNLFEPLAEALKPYGLSPVAASVEKVLAGTPKQAPFGDWLLQQGISPTAKLPFDGQMWLRLDPIGESK